MANPVAPATRGPLLWIIDPRRSLVTGAVWLIIALAATVSIAAGILGRRDRPAKPVGTTRAPTVARNRSIEFRVGQAIDARLAAVRAATGLLRDSGLDGHQRDLKGVFDDLSTTYPRLGWMDPL